MKTKIVVVIVLAFLATCLHAAETTQPDNSNRVVTKTAKDPLPKVDASDMRVAFEIKNAPLKKVLDRLFIAGNASYKFDSSVAPLLDKPIDVEIKSMPFKWALLLLLRTQGLTYHKEDNAYVIQKEIEGKKTSMGPGSEMIFPGTPGEATSIAVLGYTVGGIAAQIMSPGEKVPESDFIRIGTSQKGTDTSVGSTGTQSGSAVPANAKAYMKIGKQKISESTTLYSVEAKDVLYKDLIQLLMGNAGEAYEFDPSATPFIDNKIYMETIPMTFEEILSHLLRPQGLTYYKKGNVHVIQKAEGGVSSQKRSAGKNVS